MAIDKGDTTRLTYVHKDPSGALANAGTMTVTITLPDGTATAPATVTASTTGNYFYDYLTTQTGWHTVHWVATGANPGVFQDSFNVTDPTPQYIISLSEARTALRLTDTSQDELLRGYIEGVAEVIERHLDETIVPRTFVEDYISVRPGRWGDSIALRHRPVISITSIVSVSNLFTWDATQFHVDKVTGLVTSLPSTWGLFGDVTITYVAGRTVIPANIQQAAKIIVQHAWQTRRGAAGAAAPGGMGDTMHVSGRLGWGYALPNAALEWLGAGVSGFA